MEENDINYENKDYIYLSSLTTKFCFAVKKQVKFMIFINYYQKCIGQPLRRKFYSDIPLFQTGSLQGSQQYSFSIPVGNSAGNFSSPAILELVMVVVRKSQEHLAAGLVMKQNQDRHLFPPNTVVRFAERAITLSFQSSRNYQDQHSSPKYSGLLGQLVD